LLHDIFDAQHGRSAMAAEAPGPAERSRVRLSPVRRRFDLHVVLCHLPRRPNGGCKLAADRPRLNWLTGFHGQNRFHPPLERRILPVMTSYWNKLSRLRAACPRTPDDIARVVLQLAGDDGAPTVMLSGDETDGNLAASKEAATAANCE